MSRPEIAIQKEIVKNNYVKRTQRDYSMSFVDELKAYYDDRIFKLRKRTRTKK
ncbi:4-hydroxy-3-methylbut-2-enyl diphosphate reductase IspH [Mesonia hippocampi]|uniref:4-hydroxy-3-methylbut-2-enyl diphosphate reductase IspH n=1 Tax=Mesonia hippocampi TaxID=1628250 RepID=A0A840EM16_9FLAO|nr:hypothetical protein [Mesonia hippocampi]MBB4118030.1 4-hydroxy-3-methylbut-2-enyl diphosphate reductase IspH [Mesonia hippocampi]